MISEPVEYNVPFSRLSLIALDSLRYIYAYSSKTFAALETAVCISDKSNA